MAEYNYDTSYPSLETFQEDCLGTKKKVRALVKVADTDNGFDATEFDKWSFAEVRIENPGQYFTSSDGQMMFWKGDGRVTLLFCLDNSEKVIIPKGVTEIGRYAFSENSVKTVIMPDTVREVQIAAFAGCKELKNVKFSKNLEVIENSSFLDTGLEKFELPQSIRRISNFAFADCEFLRLVRTEGDENSIELAAKSFVNCPALKRAPQGVSTEPDEKPTFFEILKTSLAKLVKFC